MRIIEEDLDFTHQTATHNFRKHVLTVKDAQLTDSGNYECRIIDHSNNEAHNSYQMIIMGNHYINSHSVVSPVHCQQRNSNALSIIIVCCLSDDKP